MQDIGKPLLFSLDDYYSTINGYINSDEVEIALHMIDNPPAYYRDNPPAELLQMRERLHSRTWTPIQYKGIYDGVLIDEEHTRQYWPTRAQIVENLVIKMNEKNVDPNIMELAPGSLWLPHGLTHHGCRFTYERLSLDNDLGHPFRKPERPEFNIFCATEIIEHLHNPLEIYQNYLKFNREANVVLITTPLYTYGGGMANWQERELGHLRCYTPNELFMVVSNMFRGYSWQLHTDLIIHAIGEKQ